MGKDISFKNHDRFIHLGIAIAALRKMRGMSQEQLAEKAGISRSLISAIEAPGLAKSFSLDVYSPMLRLPYHAPPTPCNSCSLCLAH